MSRNTSLVTGTILVVALAAAAHANMYIPTFGLWGHWKLDGNALDSSGYGRHLDNRAVTFEPSLCGQAGVFYAPEERMLNGDHFNRAGDLTISALIKTTSTSGDRSIAGEWSADAAGYWLGIHNDGQIQYAGNQTARAVASQDLVNDGEWHHVVGMTSGGNHYLYVDNVLVGTASGGAARDLRAEFGVGGMYQSGATVGPNRSAFFTGSIDEVAYYNRPLSEVDIEQMYRSVFPEAVVPEPASAALIGCGILGLLWRRRRP